MECVGQVDLYEPLDEIAFAQCPEILFDRSPGLPVPAISRVPQIAGLLQEPSVVEAAEPRGALEFPRTVIGSLEFAAKPVKAVRPCRQRNAGRDFEWSRQEFELRLKGEFKAIAGFETYVHRGPHDAPGLGLAVPVGNPIVTLFEKRLANLA